MHVPTATRLLPAALLVLVAAAPALAGKPTGGGTAPPPPPVRFKTIWLGTQTLEVFDLNNAGMVVGRMTDTTPPRGFLATVNPAAPAGSTATVTDLNSFGAPWVDLSTGAAASGWTAVGCGAINEGARIVGRAEDSAGLSRAFLYAPDANGVWTFSLLPPIPGVMATYIAGTGVNGWNQVVGTYVPPGGTRTAFYWDAANGSVSLSFPAIDMAKVNDAGVIVADNSSFNYRQVFRYELGSGGQPVAINGTSAYDECLNSSGRIAGERATGSKATDVEIVRLNLDLSAIVIEGAGASKSVLAINDAGSVLYEKTEASKNGSVSSMLLYRDGQPLVNVAAASDQWPGSWGGRTSMSDSNAVTDPENTGYGLIASGPGNGRGYVLVPRKP